MDENIILSQPTCGTKGYKLCDSIFPKCPEQVNPQRQKTDKLVAIGWVGEEQGVDQQWVQVTLWGDGNVRN